ncbi:MAG TPA: hypothetical protein VLH56_07735 [Dissulfurispiraceae bacterium]|nr:hypothetical protein [Dissulfurispiraceae bacterium]
MIETELRKMLVPSSSAIPQIGNQLYLGFIPSSITSTALPFAVMFSISRDEMDEAEVALERIQWSCYADTMSSATEIADAIKDKVKRFYGPPVTGSTYTIVNTYYDNMVYLYDDVIHKHVKILDMLIRYRR